MLSRKEARAIKQVLPSIKEVDHEAYETLSKKLNWVRFTSQRKPYSGTVLNPTFWDKLNNLGLEIVYDEKNDIVFFHKGIAYLVKYRHNKKKNRYTLWLSDNQCVIAQQYQNKFLDELVELLKGE